MPGKASRFTCFYSLLRESGSLTGERTHHGTHRRRFYSLLRESGSLTKITLTAFWWSIGFYSLLRESGSLTRVAVTVMLGYKFLFAVTRERVTDQPSSEEPATEWAEHVSIRCYARAGH